MEAAYVLLGVIQFILVAGLIYYGCKYLTKVERHMDEAHEERKNRK
jgi:large-conductance mechanosensitive channel